jgi:hypothetical protein
MNQSPKRAALGRRGGLFKCGKDLRRINAHWPTFSQESKDLFVARLSEFSREGKHSEMFIQIDTATRCEKDRTGAEGGTDKITEIEVLIKRASASFDAPSGPILLSPKLTGTDDERRRRTGKRQGHTGSM